MQEEAGDTEEQVIPVQDPRHPSLSQDITHQCLHHQEPEQCLTILQEFRMSLILQDLGGLTILTILNSSLNLTIPLSLSFSIQIQGPLLVSCSQIETQITTTKIPIPSRILSVISNNLV